MTTIEQLSDKEIRVIIDKSKTDYGVQLISEIENYDACELSTIRVIYMRYKDYITDKGKRCYNEFSQYIRVNGPTYIDLIGYEEPLLSIKYVFENYYEPYLDDNRKRTNAKYCILSQILKIVNKYYFAHFYDPDYNFQFLWDGVLKYNSCCANSLTDQHIKILKDSVLYCISKIKTYLQSNKHLEIIKQINEKTSKLKQ